MKSWWLPILMIAALACGGAGPAGAASSTHVAPAAQPAGVPEQWDRDLFLFTGGFHDGVIEDSVLNPGFNGNYFVGGGYQQFLGRYGNLRLGVEGGAGLRFGTGIPVSGEVWAGGVARYEGLHIGDLSIVPALTAGLSAVTDPIATETARFDSIHRYTPVLFYLGPEVSFSVPQNPGLELFVRVQHRSGGFGFIAPVDAANADTIGLRWKF